MDVLIASFQKEQERVAGGEREEEKKKEELLFLYSATYVPKKK
jgi:hypothetical protein